MAKVIGFQAAGSYYFDLDGKSMLAVYGPNDYDTIILNGPIAMYQDVFARYAKVNLIYIEE